MKTWNSGPRNEQVVDDAKQEFQAQATPPQDQNEPIEITEQQFHAQVEGNSNVLVEIVKQQFQGQVEKAVESPMHFYSFRKCKTTTYLRRKNIADVSSIIHDMKRQVIGAHFNIPFAHTCVMIDMNDNQLGVGSNLRVFLDRLAKVDDEQKFVRKNPFGQGPLTKQSESWTYYHNIVSRLTTLRLSQKKKKQKWRLQHYGELEAKSATLWQIPNAVTICF
ncbi:Uncharacterized protein TCM_024255 [Theobroma cacao]|uniref:Uncharacterized protein n=1 Tax=Theobroma cacao TaxID=3641 RepID=A0A061EWB6_THECC|nr:Uncharacterized protein TCM_024255 [Theobroma cacao]